MPCGHGKSSWVACLRQFAAAMRGWSCASPCEVEPTAAARPSPGRALGLAFPRGGVRIIAGWAPGLLENVGALLQETLKVATLTRLEIHGPEVELAKLRGPLADLKPQFFVLEYGFRR